MRLSRLSANLITLIKQTKIDCCWDFYAPFYSKSLFFLSVPLKFEVPYAERMQAITGDVTSNLSSDKMRHIIIL